MPLGTEWLFAAAIGCKKQYHEHLLARSPTYSSERTLACIDYTTKPVGRQ